jgi:hypothetical protein
MNFSYTLSSMPCVSFYFINIKRAIHILYKNNYFELMMIEIIKVDFRLYIYVLQLLLKFFTRHYKYGYQHSIFKL